VSREIDAGDAAAVGTFLRERGWMPADAALLDVAPAGEGNMNLVLRVRWRDAAGAVRSVVLKQARPRVEKFPEIPAPVGRLAVEVAFYRAVSSVPRLAAAMPALLAVDEEAAAALLEDLGAAADYTGLYGDEDLAQGDLDQLLRWLSALHSLEVDAGARPRLANRDMRALNHAHLFEVPVGRSPDAGDAPALDGHCPGLQAAAAEYRRDPALRAGLATLGRVYLEDGPCLLHGDFYPGSWLATAAGPRVIDPEFGFLGRPEFDLGVLRAHLAFTGQDHRSLAAYHRPPGFDETLMQGFAGVELLRRLLGVAQLPLVADLERRTAWLAEGREAVLAAAR
jgi:5-methylthioribose kinase